MIYKSFRECSKYLANIKSIDFFFAQEVMNILLKKNNLRGLAKENSKNQNDIIVEDVVFHLLLALMSAYHKGHSCIRINKLADKVIFNNDGDLEERKGGFFLPSYTDILNILNSLDYTDLPIYFANKFDSLYIKKLWLFENEIASFIQSKSYPNLSDYHNNMVENISLKLFQASNDSDLQRIAVKKSLSYGFSIVSGGPGTGKTTTVAKMLVAMQMLSNQMQKIAILAPTGKAAQRITESLYNTLKNIDTSSLNKEVMEYLGNIEGQTIHRFLGLRLDSNQTKYNTQIKAPYDVIIVDEASMLDINIFIKLIRSIGENTQLVLIGDVNQLPSVEAGSLLANLINYQDGSLAEYATKLIKNYRSQYYINNLANDVLVGDVDIQKYKNQNISFYDLNKLANCLKIYANKYKALESCNNHKDALRELRKFRILVANKNIEIGTDQLNQKIESLLNKEINSNYKARPIMITQNNYSLGLFNGDVGIIWPDQTGRLRAYFDAKEEKTFSLNTLPQYESVYVMTIHKTQGSEFDEVAIILPSLDNNALNKQLFYTAITRAKFKLDIICEQRILDIVISKNSQRNSNINKLGSVANLSGSVAKIDSLLD